MGDAARTLPGLDESIPAEWRQHYADLAAAWVREHGTVPSSLEALAVWGVEDSGVCLDRELAYLEGRGSDQ